MDVNFLVVESDHIDLPTRHGLRMLWARAFGDQFTDDDAEHAYGGVHVLARSGERLIAHASAVPRRIKFGDDPWRTVGYVEAVAVDPDQQRMGVGRRTMQLLHEEILARWPVALLSTGRAKHFYARLGWEQWQGLSYTATAESVVPDGEHGGLMVLRLDRSVVPRLDVPVICEDRPGDAW